MVTGMARSWHPATGQSQNGSPGSYGLTGPVGPLAWCSVLSIPNVLSELTVIPQFLPSRANPAERAGVPGTFHGCHARVQSSASRGMSFRPQHSWGINENPDRHGLPNLLARIIIPGFVTNTEKPANM